MRVEEGNHEGLAARAGGACVRERGEEEGRGYPPMSNVRDSRGARELSTGHPQFNTANFIEEEDNLSPNLLQKEDTLPSSPSKKNPPKNSEVPDVLTSGIKLRGPIIPLSKETPKELTIFEILTPPKKLLPQTDRPSPLNPKKFFAPKEISDEYALSVAESMVAYFGRPLSGWYKETILNRDGSQSEVEKPYNAPLPLMAEFANMVALTESEIKQLAKAYPKTLGRAYEFAQDVVKTNLVRGGLNATYHPQFAMFTATNETNMRSKTESTVRTIDMNALLDDIENSDAPLYE